jgi:hypothetical protein
MKSCPLCRRAVEIAAEALLSHLLRGHPTAQVLAIAALSVGSIYLVDRPEYLVALYAAMFAGAWMFLRSDVVS